MEARTKNTDVPDDLIEKVVWKLRRRRFDERMKLLTKTVGERIHCPR